MAFTTDKLSNQPPIRRTVQQQQTSEKDNSGLNWIEDVSGTSVHIESRKEELDYWKHVAFILIFTCTGITVKQIKIDKWIKQNAFRIPQGRFVCGLDKTVTSDIWGQDFVTLANTIRGRNMQQQRHGSRMQESLNRGIWAASGKVGLQTDQERDVVWTEKQQR
ncbi:unnamed protein product [Fusarium graminearum]|nr:unnamed protein product [Fusarium graminearum]